MTTPHKHRDILIAIADGKKIEHRPNKEWPWSPADLRTIVEAPKGDYRIAPETVMVNGVECPKPLSDGSFGVRIDSGTRGCRTVYFASEDDRRTVFNALCKPFKSEGV